MSAMREALEKAFADSEGLEEKKDVIEGEAREVEKTEGAEAPDLYKAEARVAEADEQAEDRKAPAKPESKVEAGEKKEAVKPPEQQAQEDKAPAWIGWTNEEKAHWGRMSKEARAAVVRREKEIQHTLSQTGQIRNFANEFAGIVAPYAHLIRARNSTPLQAAKNLFDTAAGLSVGNPEQKAAIVAEICQNYGVDLEVLDAVLSKKLVNGRLPGGAQQGNMDPNMAAMFKPIYDFMENVNRSRQTYEQGQQVQAEETVEQFGENKPHFDEVRDDMADLMEMGAQRGRVITLDQAYKIAMQAHGFSVSESPDSGNGQSEVSRAASTLSRARRAASGISGAPKSGGDAPKAKGLRGALEQAYDDSERR